MFRFWADLVMQRESMHYSSSPLHSRQKITVEIERNRKAVTLLRIEICYFFSNYVGKKNFEEFQPIGWRRKEYLKLNELFFFYHHFYFFNHFPGLKFFYSTRAKNTCSFLWADSENCIPCKRYSPPTLLSGKETKYKTSFTPLYHHFFHPLPF